MIQLAMEIPVSRLEQWSPFADLDFILAHTVLEDKAYAEFFARRAPGREVIMDNSYHELGYPLSGGDLAEAARLCGADYVISPDKIGDYEFNLKHYRHTKEALSTYKIAVVWHGNDDHTLRENFLVDVHDADMLCCTFKEEKRLSYYVGSVCAKTFKRVHLLGVSELDELGAWARVSRRFPEHVFSVDTGKALKWALKEKKLDYLQTLRSSAGTTAKGEPSVLSQQILKLRKEDITLQQESIFKHNIQVLRRHL